MQAITHKRNHNVSQRGITTFDLQGILQKSDNL